MMQSAVNKILKETQDKNISNKCDINYIHRDDNLEEL